MRQDFSGLFSPTAARHLVCHIPFPFRQLHLLFFFCCIGFLLFFSSLSTFHHSSLFCAILLTAPRITPIINFSFLTMTGCPSLRPFPNDGKYLLPGLFDFNLNSHRVLFFSPPRRTAVPRPQIFPFGHCGRFPFRHFCKRYSLYLHLFPTFSLRESL